MLCGGCGVAYRMDIPVLGMLGARQCGAVQPRAVRHRWPHCCARVCGGMLGVRRSCGRWRGASSDISFMRGGGVEHGRVRRFRGRYARLRGVVARWRSFGCGRCAVDRAGRGRKRALLVSVRCGQYAGICCRGYGVLGGGPVAWHDAVHGFAHGLRCACVCAGA